MSHATDPVSMDTRLAKSFGMALRKRRLAQGLTQQELAFASSLDRTCVSLLERGKRQPSLTTIYATSNALDIEPWTLLKSMRKHN